MQGSWQLEDDGEKAIFIPAEPWKQQQKYEIRVSSSLTDNNGMNAGNEFISIFTTGIDSEKPRLISVSRIAKDGSVSELTPGGSFSGAAQMPVENSGWEKEDRLSLVFSKPVEGLSVKNCLTAEDTPSLIMETSSDYSNGFIFKFESIPSYESRFTLRIKKGIKDNAGNESDDEYLYRIFTNGKYSKPPELAGIRMPMSPDCDAELFSVSKDSLLANIPIMDEHYPSGEGRQSWIELYFITTEDALIDPFSVMEHFRIDTSNNVIAFSSHKVKSSGFTIKEPQIGWEDCIRLEITGILVNSVNFGLVNFIINAGLKDSLGNRNEKPQLISVVK
jgi:hypothetical protein